MPAISTRQQQILDFLREYHADRSYMPSIREIQLACGISSTSVVDYNLRLLERDGHIRRSPDISRAIELVGDSEADLVEVARVPILGAIAAGEPIPVPEAGAYAGDDDRESLSLPPELTPRDTDNLYALRVKGYSMIDACVTDGDIVVLRHARDARNGEMVAAWLSMQEEATLKHFYLEGENVRLMPANPSMEPIVVPADSVQVHGKVVAVMRRVAA
ncbi:MAG: transcriptional repressor LexA [Chloroflexota bacterium]|nr:transcriptional repressor LexA [Chloroflexota bacterium]MDE2884305.1 transcriptional repressor LexA [Chloroflexota bacterium]